MPASTPPLAPSARDAHPAPADAPASFEAALAELERIVAGMETGKLSLDEALAAHRRGLELARYCQAALAEAREQVRILEDETLKVFPGADASDA